MGAYAGGSASNGNPRMVSLDAQTTRFSPSTRAASKTLNVLSMFVRNVSASVAIPGAGIAARWTRASAPASTSAV